MSIKTRELVNRLSISELERLQEAVRKESSACDMQKAIREKLEDHYRGYIARFDTKPSESKKVKSFVDSLAKRIPLNLEDKVQFPSYDQHYYIVPLIDINPKKICILDLWEMQNEYDFELICSKCRKEVLYCECDRQTAHKAKLEGPIEPGNRAVTI